MGETGTPPRPTEHGSAEAQLSSAKRLLRRLNVDDSRAAAFIRSDTVGRRLIPAASAFLSAGSTYSASNW